MALRDNFDILDSVSLDLISGPGLKERYEAVLQWIEEDPEALAFKLRIRAKFLFFKTRKTKRFKRKDLLGPATFLMCNEEKP